MITFLVALALLIIGYIIYGKVTERVFGIDKDRKTPAFTRQDGMDYIPMPAWKVFMIQFLNIAGLGPIFGAIMGAKFGTASYLWIVFGCIFAGAVHDFMSGMISLRSDGISLPEIIGANLGKPTEKIMRVFTIILMILVGAVFVSGPAGILANLTSDKFDANFWIIIILVYYVLATLLPVDKIIGKIYPLFAIALLFMAAGLLGYILIAQPNLPEITDGLANKHPNAANQPLFPMLFITIACGAISGFHATQSPMMARCMKNERLGRPIFFGAMITEGIVALIWAAAATFFFSPEGQQFFGIASGSNINSNSALILDKIARTWLGPVGGVLAILGAVAAPITSGDTALRSSRLIIADFLKIDQKKISKRLLISIPIFVVTFFVLFYSLKDKDGFEIIWRYFAW
ncbi:MAG: carbon starvation CstA family protein, partial [Bacteroidales bacterium]|nr:carbon starvation CstA family protein [Bacteroidales bacterium]